MMSLIKPYRSVPIRECGEPLVAIPHGSLAFFEPHPYVAMGAPYGAASPWMLRESIVESLLKAQKNLSSHRPGWRIKLFDAYRPIAVQSFMVNQEFEAQARQQGLNPQTVSESERERLMDKVFRIYAIPSNAESTPPPHSTGAAFDCTLVDESGKLVNMGCPIDENSDLASSDYFEDASDAAERHFHSNRSFLHELLRSEGMRRNPGEWWHFSRGDQLATWVDRDIAPQAFAIYGRADLLASQ